MNTSIQAVVEVSLYDLQTPKARKAWSNGANVCAICGQHLKEGDNIKYVHYLTNGNIVSSFEDFENSQGYFPVGPECAKKLIIDFTKNID